MKNVLYFLGFLVITVVIGTGAFLAAGGDINNLLSPTGSNTNTVQDNLVVPPGADKVETPSGDLPEVIPTLSSPVDTLAMNQETQVDVSIEGPLTAIKGITLNIEFDPTIVEIGKIDRTGEFKSYTFTGVNPELKILSIVAGGYEGPAVDNTDVATFVVKRIGAGTISLKIHEFISENQGTVHSSFIDLADNILSVNSTSLTIN